MKCSNNMKQIALANMNYESAYGTFVPGVSRLGCCWGTWMVPILPYMEQDNLFKLYINFGGIDTGWTPRYSQGQNGSMVSNKRLPTFLCPSDTAKNWNGGSLTMHNYVLNTGNTSLYQANIPIGCTGGNTTGTSGNGCVTYGQAPFGWYEDPATLANGGDASPPNYGVDDVNLGKSGRPRTFGDLTDGTSNTVCLSEVILGPRGGSDIRGFTWWGGGAGFTTYQTPNNRTALDVMTGGGCGPGSEAQTTTDPNYPCTLVSTSTLPRMQLARSRHTQGVNAAMCDGSVRFVRNTIDLATWRAMGTAQGGEVFNNQ
jgi:prepilin-type processing-associated H-X9-DG protein